MECKKFKLTLYLIADKLRLAFYLIAAFVVIVPISIVLATGNAFNSFYSKIFISIAITFIIIGRMLTAFKKIIENGTIPWSIISSIIGLLIVLIWGLVKY